MDTGQSPGETKGKHRATEMLDIEDDEQRHERIREFIPTHIYTFAVSSDNNDI